MIDQQVDHATEDLRREFDALPGLHLTFWQAQRLLNLTEPLCDRALARLLDTGYLVRLRTGGFRRAATRDRQAAPPSPERHAV